MPCALVEANAVAPSKIASAQAALPLAARLHANVGADVFQFGQ